MFVYRNGAVQAVDPVSGQEIWPAPSLLKQRPRLLAALREVIILTTRFEILGLHPGTGKVLWRYGEAGEDFDDPAGVGGRHHYRPEGEVWSHGRCGSVSRLTGGARG